MSPRMGVARIIAAAVGGVLSSGCSWAFMTKPPEVVSAPNYPIDCTTSRAAPILDTVCLGYFILNGAVLAAQPDCASAGFGQSCVSQETKTGGIVLSAGLGLLCAISAASGYGYASQCEQKKDLNALCIGGDQGACRQLRPGWLPAAPAAMPPPQAPGVGGCGKDTDCKGDRICSSGVCVSPSKPRPAAPPAPRCERDSDCDRGICFEGVCRE